MSPSRANAMQRPDHGRNDVRSAVGSEPWWERDERPGDTMVRRCGTGATTNVAARHVRPRRRCSAMSTPINWTAAAAADHCTAARGIMGPDSRRGGRGRTPSPGASSPDEQAGDHERKLVAIVDKSLRGQPQPQQQRSNDATDDGTPHGPEDRANRVAIVRWTARAQPLPNRLTMGHCSGGEGQN